jgi:hypothetical protein
VTGDPAEATAAPPPAAQHCANCGTGLRGEYCLSCGQRHDPHVHSVAHFAGEALESLSHADSRLWRTLWLLVSRPGRLTREFFAGRRASYLPPFRLYLVLSVLFFIVAGLPANEPDYVAAQTKAAPAPGPSGTSSATPMPTAAPAARVDPDPDPDPDADFVASRGTAAPERGGLDSGKPTVTGLADFCNAFQGPEAASSNPRAYRNIREFCANIETDSAAVGEAVMHNLPRAMFIFLPLLAAIMKLLYWRPKRYYVEHLLFLVHNHAFVFLAFGVLGLLSLWPVTDAHAGWLYVAMLLYAAWYIFRGMRNVYGQGRALTLGKYVLLGVAYLTLSFAVLVTTLVFSTIMA